MKLVFAAVFLAFYLSAGVDSATVKVTKQTLTISGNANVNLNVPIQEILVGISDAHRYPTINSGDTIALRSAHSSYSTSWLKCYTSYCRWTSCQGSYITSSGWSSCNSRMRFIITARGKQDGEPINSGDTVSLSSIAYGTSYRLYCVASSSTKCRTNSVTSSMKNNWLKYSYATFEIYSKYANDDSPVQYGDVVGLKFPYYTNSAWLYYYGGRFYPRSCSRNSKTSCAAENTYTGFRIFKKL